MSGETGGNAQQPASKEYSFGPKDVKHISDVEKNEQDKEPTVDQPRQDAGGAPGFGDFHTYFHQRKHKLAEQAEQHTVQGPQRNQIFAGVVFHINGYTQPSQYELKRLLIERGGRFLHYLAKKEVTHIIASNLTMSKTKEFKNYRVVRPEWVLHCISAGKQLPWQRYSVISQSRSNARNLPVSPGICVDDLCEFEADTNSGPQAVSGFSGQRQQPSSAPVTTFVVDRFGEGLNREWVRRNLATEPDFIQRYYANSRLHHLSTWKAELRDYVAQLRQKRNKAKASGVFGTDGPRVIMHVDFDCFFVSASLLSYPHLKDRPVAVCHSHKQLEDYDSNLSANPLGSVEGTSQIASCNYTARSFGVTNGMFMNRAVQLCPTLVAVPYVFEAYKRISRALYKIVTQIADETQAVSVDEVLLDVTQAVRQDRYQGDPRLLAQDIRRQVFEATKCVTSVGIGSSILLARIATASAKPNGVFSLDCESYIGMDIPIGRLPGVGYAVEDSLNRHGIRNVADIRESSLEQLKAKCGEKTALTLHKYSYGIDDRVLESDQLRQAFGADISWGVRFSNQDEAEDFVNRMAHEVCKSMKAAGRIGGSVSLKIKRRREGQGKPGKFLGHGICDNLSKSAPLPQMTNDPSIIAPLCIRLLHQILVDPLDIRGVGVQVQKLNTNSGASDIGEMLTKSKQSTSEENPRNDQISSELLPSASQIDVNVLKELPESIRAELLAAYKTNGSSIGPMFISRPPVPTRDLVQRPSTAKVNNKRGRPRKLLFTSSSTTKNTAARPKQNLLDAFSKIRSLDTVMPSQIDGDVWNSLPTNIRRELAKDYLKSKPKPIPESTKKESVSGTNGDRTLPPTTTVHTVPMLLGKHELSDVRALVREWVDASSESGPLEEDIVEFGDYIESLLKHRDILKARCVLSFWKVVCFCKSNRALWSGAVKRVLDQTNRACMAMYGAKLYM